MEALESLISERKKDTYFLQNDQTASGFRPASCQLGAGLPVRSCKVARPDFDNSSRFNVQIFTSDSAHVCLHGVGRENFTFTFICDGQVLLNTVITFLNL
jgi:hypothetical protein